MQFETNVDLDLNDLAYELAKDRNVIHNDYEMLHDFIVTIDEYVDDLQFTKALHSRLSGIIAECEDE